MTPQRSFVFAFKAPQATSKLIVGGVFSMLFFTVFFAFVIMGYLMRILCNTLEGRDAKLPDWKDLSGLFHEGMGPILVILTYFGPLIVLIIVELLLYSVIGTNQVVFALFSFIRLVCYLLISALIPLALIRFVVIGSFPSSFHLGRIFAFIKENPRHYLPAWGLSLATVLVAVTVGLCATFTGSLVLGIVFFFLLFIAYVISVHLYAGAYRASTPFPDDQDGDVRASVTLPPPLNR
jgi:hypothetical protein